jgi:hypothetical protein
VTETRLVLLATVITERTLCADCIRTKTTITPDQLQDYVRRLGRIVTINESVARCSACGYHKIVFSSKRP